MQPKESTIAVLPGGAEEQLRRRHSALRHRLLTGHWQRDLEEHILQHFPLVRAAELGKPDMSRNLFATIINQIAALYSSEPSVTNEDEGGATAFMGVVDEAGLWQLAQRNQRFQIGLRESIIRFALVGDEPRLQFRVVPVDQVYCLANPDEPDEPALYVEARLRDMDGEKVWTWDYLDIRDPDDPKYKVLYPEDESTTIKDAIDVSERYLGGDFSGANYPYRYEDGTPFLPLALYHAERTGRLWDWGEKRSLVEGTLTVATCFTFFLHVLKDSSWPQRYVVGAVLRGQTTRGSGFGAHSSVPADPASILQFTADGTGTPQLGQWQPGGNPERLELALSSFERNLAVHYGISSSDLETNASQAQSGYAISLRRSAIRETQRRYEPQNRRADLQLLSRAAAACNRAGLGPFPESEYRIRYEGLPRTPTELAAAREQALSDIRAGIATPVDLMIAKRPGITREQAEASLAAIAEERRRLAAFGITSLGVDSP